MPDGFLGGGQGFKLDASTADGAGDAYDMPDGFGLTFVDGNAATNPGGSTTLRNDDDYEVPIAVLQAAADSAHAYEMPASVQHLQGDGDKSLKQKFKRKPSIYNGFGDEAAAAGTSATAAKPTPTSGSESRDGDGYTPYAGHSGRDNTDADGAYDEVKPYDEIDSVAPYDEVVNPYAEVDKPYDEVDSGAYDDVNSGAYDEVDSGAYDEVGQNETEL